MELEEVITKYKKLREIVTELIDMYSIIRSDMESLARVWLYALAQYVAVQLYDDKKNVEKLNDTLNEVEEIVNKILLQIKRTYKLCEDVEGSNTYKEHRTNY